MTDDNIVRGRFQHYRLPPAPERKAMAEAAHAQQLADRLSAWATDAELHIGCGPAENMLLTTVNWIRMRALTKWRGNR